MAKPALTESLIRTAIDDLINETLRDRFIVRGAEFLNRTKEAVLTAQEFLGIDPELLEEAIGDRADYFLREDYTYSTFKDRVSGTSLLCLESEEADIWPAIPIQEWNEVFTRNDEGFMAVEMPCAVSPIALEFLYDCLYSPKVEGDALMRQFITEHAETFESFRGALESFIAIVLDAGRLEDALSGATEFCQIRSWKKLEKECSSLVPYILKAAEKQGIPTEKDIEDLSVDDLIACMREGDCG